MGFGVALSSLGERCTALPVCRLVPPEGVFRPVTAWIEPPIEQGSAARLVLAGSAVRLFHPDGTSIPLAVDSSAAFANGIRRSKLRRLAWLGLLLGAPELSRREGLYILEDYDPYKHPVIMIHGLGSSPLAWAKLSNAVWEDPELSRRYQVWHVVYSTDAPLLVTRRRIERLLDEAWLTLDPDGDDQARSSIVLIGHSMGGVIARLLTVDSTEALWSAAFLEPLSSLHGRPDDLGIVDSIFHFAHFPGVARAIFIAAPHGGSYQADRWLGTFVRRLVGRRAQELASLQRIARSNPRAVQPELRQDYMSGRLNSISTLRTQQAVSRAGASLVPRSASYHTIAGALPNRFPLTDGVVALKSASLEGAESVLILQSGHDLYNNEGAIAEVLRILRLQSRAAVAP
jgi:pimeloyl-ACP methyl ester carboxylesterase